MNLFVIFNKLDQIHILKEIIRNLICLLILAFQFNIVLGQDTFSYDIHRNYAPLSLEATDVHNAKTISDLNKNFEADWVKEYLKVEISSTINGVLTKAVGKDIMLTSRQREILNKADSATDIVISVKYMPDNNLSHNDPQELGFSFIVEPERVAEYPGGAKKMKAYLEENVRDKISKEKFKQYQLTVVKFTIDEEGLVIDPQLFWSSEDEETDIILKSAVCNMPRWIPAKYNSGLKVKQEFVLTVGDMESCVTPLLGIRPHPMLDKE